MPIREYVCNKCKQKFEVLELKPEDKPTRCTNPQCKSKNIKEIEISLPSVVFKGTGWFKTGGY